MADDDHQKIIERVLELVRRQLKESGMLEFTALMIDEEGRERCIDIDPAFFRTEANKDRLKEKMRRDFRRRGIVRYALVAQCWMGHHKPMPSAPVRIQNLTHYLDRYADEYRRQGYSPRAIVAGLSFSLAQNARYRATACGVAGMEDRPPGPRTTRRSS